MAKSVELGSKAASMASYVLFGKLFTLILVGVAFILVSRKLGPEQYGIYTLATAFAGIFGTVGYFGTGTALQKFIAQYNKSKSHEEANHLVSNALVIVLVTGSILVAAFLALSSLISQYVYHTAAMSFIIDAISIWIITAMLFGTMYDALIGFGGGRDVAILAFGQSFFQAVIAIGLAYLGFGALAPIYGLVFGYMLGFFVGLYLVFKNNNINLKMPSRSYMKMLFSFSVPVAISNIFGSIASNIGLIYLGYFVSTAVIGNIGIAARTNSFVSLVFDSVGLAILPVYSAALSDKRASKDIGKMYGYTIYFAILLVAPALFYMAAFSTPFSQLLFGSNYSSAPLYISIASVGLLVGIIGTYANTLFLSSGQVKLSLGYNAAIYTVLLLLLVLVIPTFGGLGYAIVSFVAIPFLVDVLFVVKLRKLYKLDLKLNKIARLVLASLIPTVVFVLLGNYVGGVPLLAISFVGILVSYPLLAVLLGGADQGDINTIKQLSSGIPLVGMAIDMLANYASMVIG
ncbi:MAG: oligosaccharide flippase family protein [Candidatus Micrarchaeota archaeon]|nr:oligosaccharide flippase family protein [Candidatus Micrarchaeota archaeon]MDE1859604.1 oligosaccharide flippase family protein [Candidatus Micrarchaeota archaeon]